MSNYPDPDTNSGRVMQPGAAIAGIARTAPVVVDEAGDFDAAVADVVTEVDVAEAEKPVVRRRKAAEKVAPVEEVAAPSAE